MIFYNSEQVMHLLKKCIRNFRFVGKKSRQKNNMKIKYCLPLGSDYLNRKSATFFYFQKTPTQHRKNEVWVMSRNRQAHSIKNEVLEMIAKVAKRKGRLDLPIVSGKHLRRISSREVLQSADNAEKFITTRKIDSHRVSLCRGHQL